MTVGTNELDNLVFFTPKEHVIAHHLLNKFEPTKKHFYAWHYLTFTDNSNCGYKNRLTSNEYNELVSKNIKYHSNRVVSEETRKKLSKTSSGENNAMYGKHWYTNGINNIALNDTETIPEGYHKGRMDVIPKDKKYSTKDYSWYNNGIINKMFKKNENIPLEFKLGMIKNVRYCYNNGIINKYFNNNDVIPEGFVKGKLKRGKNEDKNSN